MPHDQVVNIDIPDRHVRDQVVRGLMRWRDWLVMNVPDDVINRNTKRGLSQLGYKDVITFVGSTRIKFMAGPLDFFWWQQKGIWWQEQGIWRQEKGRRLGCAGEEARIQMDRVDDATADYLAMWFVSWPSVFVEVTDIPSKPSPSKRCHTI